MRLSRLIDNATGQLIDIGGSTTETNLGADAFALVARVAFDPKPEHDIPNDLGERYITPNRDQSIDVGNTNIHLVNTTETDRTLTIPLETTIWPVMYDLDDSGVISFGDLSKFADAFGFDVGDPNVEGTHASDFDHGGSVSFGDLAIFADNFGRDRWDPDRTQYVANFPADWQPAALRAGRVQSASTSPAPQRLTDIQLKPIVQAAIELVSADADPNQVAILESITVEIVDLPDCLLGEATAGTILIDRDAANVGRFVDPTPLSNEEFQLDSVDNEFVAMSTSEARDRYDLLTVLVHEFKHVLGFEHSSESDLMSETLPVGIRRLPTEAAPLVNTAPTEVGLLEDVHSDDLAKVWNDLDTLPLL